MSDVNKSTLPKPFVFVLMPFDKSFNDIYKFGIKGAADDVGAYAERVDEQIFNEGMLDRIFNQISKADVIVADMTGRNPNVFYEVGYAHALGKLVILLTKDANDIPFDLKHRQHTVYGGQIELLRRELASKLQWAIAESKSLGGLTSSLRLSLQILDSEIPLSNQSNEIPLLTLKTENFSFSLPIQIRNDSLETVPEITHVYLFANANSKIIPTRIVMPNPSTSTLVVSRMGLPGIGYTQPLKSFNANPVDAPDGLSRQFRLNLSIPPLPPGAVEEETIPFIIEGEAQKTEIEFRLRLHSSTQYNDYSFKLNIEYSPKTPENNG